MGLLKDNWAIITFFFISGFLMLTFALVLTEYIGVFQDAGLYSGKLAEAGDGFLNFFVALDYSMVVILVVLIIGAAYTAFFIRSRALNLLGGFILVPFLGFVSYFFNYAFGQVVSEGVFSGVVGSFPVTILICTNLHWVSLVSFVVSAITMWAKDPGEEDLGGLVR